MKSTNLVISLLSIFLSTSIYANSEKECAVNDPKGELELFKQFQVKSTKFMDNAERIYYTNKHNEYGDLRLPAGKGPFPVIVIIHGGAWQSSANLDYMARIAHELTQNGFATWNIEYSRLGTGGEWPNSFKSVSAATDYLKTLATKYPLDLNNVLTLGHSSGGHYALWLAGRNNFSDKSQFYSKDFIKIKGVISLDGTPDLESFSKLNRGKIIPKVLGEPSMSEIKLRLAETSPRHMNMSNVKQYFLTQYSDRYPHIKGYIDHIKSSGGEIKYKVLCKGNHFTVADFGNAEVKNEVVNQAKIMIK